MKRTSIESLIFVATVLLASHQIRKIDARTVGCGGKPADVVFLLDASNSIWRPHFRRQLQFVKDMIDWFTVGRDRMRVALVTYADYPQLQFHLHDHFTKPRLHAAVDAVRQNRGYHTRTGRALAFARQNVLRGGGGGAEARTTNVTKVVVVVTDGLSDDRTATAAEAERTKAAGVHVFAVGVGKDVDLQELDAIASRPSKYYTILVDGYEGLGNILELLAIKTCTVTDPTTTSSTVATTTTASTTTTTTKPSATTTYVSSSYSNGNDYHSTVSDVKVQTPTTHGNLHNGKVDNDDKNEDNDDDDDDNGSDDRNGTLRTPVILSPPTLIPHPSESSSVAEFQVPDGKGNSTGASNCSLGGAGRTDGDDGKTEITNRTEGGGVPVATTRAPCGSVRDGSARPESGKIEDGRGGNRSATSTGGNGHMVRNEYGYWIGSRFVKFENGTAVGGGGGGRDRSDVQPLTGKNDSIHRHHNVVIDTDRITEGDVKENDRKKGLPDRNDPRYRIYFNSGPWGTGGYWYLDEKLGYVWYRYVRPGEFELDLNTTYKMREMKGGSEQNRTTETTDVGSFNGRKNVTTIISDSVRVTSEPQQYESTADSRTPSQTSNGYWGRDEWGKMVWYRRVEDGSFQILYPKDTTTKPPKDDNDTDEKVDNNIETSTWKLPDSGPKIRFQSSAARSQASTPSTPRLPGERPENGGSDFDDSRQAAEGIGSHDLWTFATGRRVWIQYVPPNGRDEDDNDGQTEQLIGPSDAIEIPLDAVMAAVDDTMTKTTTTTADRKSRDGRRLSRTERRRVWHSWKSLRSDNGSVASEEFSLGPHSGATDDDSPVKIRLDDERGRHLWRQLANLTRLKPSRTRSFSDVKERFEGLKGELGDSSRTTNGTEQLHDSFWFYDDIGRRFQVIHRYNASAVDRLKLLDESENSSLSQRNVLLNQLIGNLNWEQEESERRGRPPKDHDRTGEYENYGGEYWIRVLSSTDEINSEKGDKVETQHHPPRTNISIELSIENNSRARTPQQLPTTIAAQKETSRSERKKPGRRDRDKKKQKNSTETGKYVLVKPDKGKPSEDRSAKRQNRKSDRKGCRSKLPINIIFAMNSDNKDRIQYMLDVAQGTVANLTARSTAGVLVGYYPEDGGGGGGGGRGSSNSGRATKTTDTTRRRTTDDNMVSSIGRMFSEYAAERKRSGGGGGGGGGRVRKILVLLTDGESEEEERSGKFRKLRQDVEFYAVGVGERANMERLQKLAEYSKSRRKHLFPHYPALHDVGGGSGNISDKLLSAICL